MGKIEFDDKKFTAKEYINDLPSTMSAGLNSIAKGMSRRCNMSFNDIMMMQVGDFMESVVDFRKKHRMGGAPSPFLVKS
ncbi:unnamed protein product [marine sediment metagenome]|uniref:Uncharacterized protein n=1 Tax=marine sediment metagenome TaxID=412755 RepID=X0U3R0_9ZZZZ